MTALQTEMLTLTKDDIKALRFADSVSFHVNEHTGPVIRAHLDVPRYSEVQQRLFPIVDTFADGRVYERRRDIVVTGSVSQYAGHRDGAERLKVGFAMVHSARFSEIWQTIAASLRPGDQVALSFRADSHTSELLREHGLHGDTLVLRVERPEPRGVKRLTFLVASEVSLSNSARMCKPF